MIVIFGFLNGPCLEFFSVVNSSQGRSQYVLLKPISSMLRPIWWEINLGPSIYNNSIGPFATEVVLNPHVRLLSLICKVHNVQTLHYRNINIIQTSGFIATIKKYICITACLKGFHCFSDAGSPLTQRDKPWTQHVRITPYIYICMIYVYSKYHYITNL